MRMTQSWVAAALIAVLGGTVPAWAQTPAPAPEAKKEEEKPKTFWEEHTSQGLLARGKSMDTISVSLYYSFF